jgi:benzoyl-CoA reductase/2-hydroxyglutaryl-CoA dehydratase subunit BcrC/BadD/HgdB
VSAFAADGPAAWFGNMIENCLQYADSARQAGKHIVGIMCEFTPRELIMAADGVPVCLCGGSEKTIPAAEEHLPANLCPLIKSTYGYHVEKSNPFLEMADLVVAETTCDGKKKMYELMAESRPMHVLELPQKADDPDALEHWIAELRKLRTHLETQFGCEVTDAKLRDAIGVMNRERSLRRRLAEFMASDRPPLTGRQLLDLKSIISGVDADLEQYEKAIEQLGSDGPPSENGSPVRVLMTGVPMAHGAERVLEIVESSGAVVVCLESCTGLKPILEDVDESAADPIRALAEKYFHLPCSVMTCNDRRMDTLRELAQQYQPECVVDLIWQACITYDVESNRVKRLVENELGLPYLRIETDYSPSDSARISVRVEALLETVRSRRSGQA